MRRSYLDTENIILEVSGRERILNAAASLFGELGYEKTSIRSISRESGMKPGSIYYFFQSKEEILLEIYASGFRLMADIVLAAVCKVDDPWDQLYAACAAHLEGIFEHRTFIEVTVRELPDRYAEPARSEMKKCRNHYEQIFSKIIDEIPLHHAVDRSTFRLSLLGSLAWTLVWYRPGGRLTPRDTARNMVDLFRKPCSGIEDQTL